MSEMIPMFSHPVLTIDDYPNIDVIADEFYAKSIALMKEYPDGGLISDAWHSGKRAESEADFKQYGFTSFYNVNLGKRQDFAFMNKVAMSIFAEYLRLVGKSDVVMRLDNAWSSVYGRGHFIPQHTHPLSHLSMAFYASATEGTGQLIFQNPARAHFEHFYPPGISWMNYRTSVQPKKGLFVVFPSYLAHHTQHHESDDLRVIYSANVQLQFEKTTDADKKGESTQSDFYQRL
jgi:uncharacterized protein (TIGR02466 family)